MEHLPPNCGSQHAKIAFAYTRRYQSDAGRLETYSVVSAVTLFVREQTRR